MLISKSYFTINAILTRHKREVQLLCNKLLCNLHKDNASLYISKITRAKNIFIQMFLKGDLKFRFGGKGLIHYLSINNWQHSPLIFN